MSTPSTPSDVLTLAPAPRLPLTTRRRLHHTRLGETHRLIQVDAPSDSPAERPSLATRRYHARRRQRRKRVLLGVALVLGLFPPMWAVYLIGWLVWRSRPPQQALRRVHKGIRALEKEQAGVALRHLQEAHYLDPSNNDALYWLGLLLSQQQRYDEAADVLSIVAERLPGMPEVEAALAQAFTATDEPQQAVYHAQRLLEAAPHAPQAMLVLAEAFEAEGRLDLAIQTLEHAPLHQRILSPDVLEIQYRLGILHERLGRPEQALHHFKRVYAQDVTFRDVRARVLRLEAPGAPHRLPS